MSIKITKNIHFVWGRAMFMWRLYGFLRSDGEFFGVCAKRSIPTVILNEKTGRLVGFE